MGEESDERVRQTQDNLQRNNNNNNSKRGNFRDEDEYFVKKESPVSELKEESNVREDLNVKKDSVKTTELNNNLKVTNAPNLVAQKSVEKQEKMVDMIKIMAGECDESDDEDSDEDNDMNLWLKSNEKAKNTSNKKDY